MIMVWTPPHQLQHQHQHLAPGCLGLRMDGASTCGTHAALSNKVRTPTTARPLRGVGIPSRTLSRIALHAVHDDRISAGTTTSPARDHNDYVLATRRALAAVAA